MTSSSKTILSRRKNNKLPTLPKQIIHNVYGRTYAQNKDTAVLLINLGSPHSPEVKDVAQYLTTFLMDERVMSLSVFWRTLLVKGLIVPRRAKYSAANYRCIWDSESETFPLVRHSAALAAALADNMQRCVGLAMRYGEPSMDATLQELFDLGIRSIHVLPLYPHYTRSSFETAAVYALERVKILGLDMKLDIMDAFYEHKAYRQVLADSVQPYLTEGIDKLIVSMHGIPVSHLTRPCRIDNGQTDRCLTHLHTPQQRSTCYRLHCEESANFLRQDLGLSHDKLELVYQSRLGRHEWMRPYFSERVRQWAHEGAKRIAVVCPGFICDCLETIHEVDVEYREEFRKHGGEQLVYIPCLNSSTSFVEVLRDIILSHESKR